MSRGLVVRTTSGPVRGRAGPHGRVFRSIPYAAPPAGDRRFAPPQPHPGWSQVRDATQPGPTSPQPRRGQFGDVDISPAFGDGWVPGDDYLTADIWTPDDASGLPVLVFVHGGAFIAGSARAPLYDGDAFARDGVVLVAINYRLGIPGFLHLPGAPDNRGRLDVLAALNWIRSNATAFGGDPEQITLAGQSAGAMIVASIVADPAARTGIRRAISQSGSGTCAHTTEQATRVTEAVGRLLGVTPSAAALADVADEQLVDVPPAVLPLDLTTATAFDPLGGISALSLVQDQQPAVQLAGHPAGIDLLIGSTLEEGALYLAPSGVLETTTEADVRATAARFHPDPEALIATYRRTRPGATPGDLRVAILSDGVFRAGTQRLTGVHAAGPGRTFAYEFTWRPDTLGGTLGAAHLVDLPFVFDRAGMPELNGPGKVLGTTPPPPDLAQRMHSAWVRFARSGDPGWPEYTPENPVVQEIGSTWRELRAPHAQEYAAWG